MAKILVVDDNIDMLETLEHLFTFYEFEVVKAENGKQGIEVAEAEQPGLIILDALMPVMNGFEACEKLKKNSKTKDIPVIFLSANYTEREHQLKGFELGADDYILKPFNAKELIAKVNSLLNRKLLINKLRQDNRQLIEQRHHSNPGSNSLNLATSLPDEIETIDPLTGLFNGFFFTRCLESEYNRPNESDEAYTLALLDIDGFQKINETYGEQSGDYILMKIANVILQNARTEDIICRLEKNRFGILFPMTEERQAFQEAERIRTAIHHTEFFDQDFFELKRFTHKRKPTLTNITVSVGLNTIDRSVERKTWIKRAEEALSKAKQKGKNVTVRYSELIEA